MGSLSTERGEREEVTRWAELAKSIFSLPRTERLLMHKKSPKDAACSLERDRGQRDRCISVQGNDAVDITRKRLTLKSAPS